jgi:exodeoxyribonuclease-5
MISNKLYEAFKSAVEFELTAGQDNALKAIAEFILGDEQQIFLLKGYAGTGKTTVVSIISKTLGHYGINTVLLAPTGRAAKVLSGVAGKPAFTIHKHIYRKNTAKGFDGKFSLNFNKNKNTLFVVDEASMISAGSKEDKNIFGSGSLLDDLLEYVFSGTGNKLLFVGDTAQLPPVKEELSPALSEDYLRPYVYEIETVELTDITRQSESSGIIRNATLVRNILSGKRNFESLKLELYADVIYPEPQEVWELIEDSYAGVGKEETAIITVSNKAANAYNATIRRKIFDYDEEITVGDILMIVRNNYLWSPQDAPFPFLANGDFLKVNDIYGFEEKYGFRFADVNISLLYYPDYSLDVKLLLDTIYSNNAALTYDEHKVLYERVAESYGLKSKRKTYEKVMEDKYFNALEVKFAYAVTCHKAQGGQWENVFIDQGHFNFSAEGSAYLRWLYTAVTRAKSKLYLVNFAERFVKR